MARTTFGTYASRPAARRTSFGEQAAPELTVRRGARVVGPASELGVGHVEGSAYFAGRAWHVIRYGVWGIGYAEQGTDAVVAVDAGTVLVEDEHNNVGRLCNVRGDYAAGNPGRCWRVAYAVNGRRYVVVHLDTAEVRVVDHRFDMTNLY